jgi:lysophospholipase L1-like esterase
MYKVKSFFLLLFCLVSLCSSAQVDTLNAIREFRQRGGLPNTFDKLAKGKPVRIGYLGGSITAAKDGWREQSLKWFQTTFSKAVITQIAAGVGGTGSDLGVFRLKNDILLQKPDLLFVEFAVNDGGLAPEKIHQTMEGIVRQVWRDNPYTDICFVYTLSGNMLPTLSEGKLWPSMLAMEKIAEYYQIPSVQFAKEVLRKIAVGELVFQGKVEENPNKMVFSTDNVHPLAATGHKLYAEALIRSLKTIQTHAKKYKHPIGAPFSKDNWEDAQMIPISEAIRTGKWDLLTQQDSVAKMLKYPFPNLYKTSEVGAAIKLKMKGRLVGMYDVIGPGCSQYEVKIDGQESKLYPRFDKYGNYYHSNYFLLPMMENKVHEVEWKLSGVKLNKMEILKKGNNPVGSLNRYEEQSVYAGWLLILGKK